MFSTKFCLIFSWAYFFLINHLFCKCFTRLKFPLLNLLVMCNYEQHTVLNFHPLSNSHSGRVMPFCKLLISIKSYTRYKNLWSEITYYIYCDDIKIEMLIHIYLIRPMYHFFVMDTLENDLSFCFFDAKSFSILFSWFGVDCHWTLKILIL